MEKILSHMINMIVLEFEKKNRPLVVKVYLPSNSLSLDLATAPPRLQYTVAIGTWHCTVTRYWPGHLRASLRPVTLHETRHTQKWEVVEPELFYTRPYACRSNKWASKNLYTRPYTSKSRKASSLRTLQYCTERWWPLWSVVDRRDGSLDWHGETLSSKGMHC